MTNFNIMGKSKIWVSISAALVVASIVLLFTHGLNLGLDFTGGVLLERQFQKPVTAAQVRDVLTSPELESLDLAQSVIQPAGDGSEVLIRTKALKDQEIRKVDTALEKEFGKVHDLRTDMVEPVIGSEMLKQAGWALLLSWLLIMAYVAFRFEYRFGIAAILAVMHDVIITMGFFALTGREVSSTFVAAILTIVGYSINDTIVIFDRIRENLRLRRKEGLVELVNSSINETLSRTIITNLMTQLTVVAILLFGGATLKDFSLALFFGTLVGTYSTIYVASPLWIWLRSFEERKRPVGKAAKA
jgi:preprotein translocase subunit SecF